MRLHVASRNLVTSWHCDLGDEPGNASLRTLSVRCQCIDELDEPNARASLIWIVGEYAEKIDNAGEILTSFVETFAEEFPQVRDPTITCWPVLTLVAGPATDPYRGCKALFEEARPVARFSSKGIASCYSGERQPRHSGPRIRLLETSVK